jgi:TatD DNase family protein
MILTDTHTHLYYESDALKRAELMQRCAENSISRLFLPNVDVASVTKINDLIKAYPAQCFPMLGLHPCSVKEDWEEQLAAISANKNDFKIVAIGEIGIDLYWDKTTLADQQ